MKTARIVKETVIENRYSHLRFLSQEKLKEAIQASIDGDFNRQGDYSILKEADTKFHAFAQLYMVHKHRHFVPCESHARLGVTIKRRGRKSPMHIIIDVPMALWKNLPHMNELRPSDN
jgi:hypothetical protein